MFVDVWEGLNVRLAISKGETATWSGQMSMGLGKRAGWLLQAKSMAWQISPGPI
jgi:hypothetical protein